MAIRKFIRKDWKNYSKLGRRRKKLQKYRRGKGIDNKMRLKIKGHIRNISIGFKSEKKKRYLIKGLKPVLIYKIEDLKNLKEKEIGVIASVGVKRKLELAKYAKEKNIKLENLNPDVFLEKIDLKIKKRREEKKIEKEKKVKKRKKEIEKTTEKRKEEAKEEKTIEDAVKLETDIKENAGEKK